MFQKIMLSVLLLCLCQVASSQQILFHPSKYDAPGKLFGRRYNDLYNGYATLEKRGIFVLKNVRKINIYNTIDSLLFFLELDRRGSTIEEGYQGQYYFRTHRKIIEHQDTFECRIWRIKNLMVRKDTSEIYHRVYRNADTVMEYNEYNLSVFKTGKLINEQNDFYSREYLNHPGAFKNDYDSTVFYLCSRKYYRSNFSASIKKGQINLDTNFIKDHSFFKRYNRQAFYKQFVEGEEFVEPTNNFVRCGTVITSPEPYQTLNDNELFDKQYYNRTETTLMFYAKYDYYEKP